MRSNRRTRIGLSGLQAIILSTPFVLPGAFGATRTWDNGGSTNRWDDFRNWSQDFQPTLSDTAVFAGSASGVIRLTDTNNGTVSAGTLQITQTPSNFASLAAGPTGGSVSVASLNFGSFSGVIYAFAGSGTAGSQRDFVYGANRSTQGTLVTTISDELKVQVRDAQTFKMLSTINGSGSISIIALSGTTNFGGQTGAGLALGATDQSADGVLDTNNTFTGGVVVKSGGLLFLGESSNDTGATVNEGPCGTGTLTLEQGARIAGARTGSSNAIAIGNRVTITGGFDSLDNIDITFRNQVDITANAQIGVAAQTGSLHTMTMGGTINGSNGFIKAGDGTLRLTGNSSSALSGSLTVNRGIIQVESSGALGATGSSNAATVSVGVGGSGTFDQGAIRFNGGVNYTGNKVINIKGTGYNNAGAIESLSGNNTFGGTVALYGDGDIRVTSGTLSMTGTIDLAGHTLTKRGFLQSGGTFTAAGTLDLSGVALVGTKGKLLIPEGTVILGSSGTALGTIDQTGSGSLAAAVIKANSGSITVDRVRVKTAQVSTGALNIASTANGTLLAGTTLSTSVVDVLTIAGGDSPTAKLDLNNNDLIIDYTGTSPLVDNDIDTGIARKIQAGYASGSWNGNGITSTDAQIDNTLYGLGYAEQLDIGTTEFSGQMIDTTSVLIKFTYVGDADLTGSVTVDDFALQGANFNESNRLWYDGDFNYDGTVDIGDFALLATNFNLSEEEGGLELLRPFPGFESLGLLYVAVRQYDIIWDEVVETPALYAMFEPYTTQDMSRYMAYLPASIPEPRTALLLFAGATAVCRRRI